MSEATFVIGERTYSLAPPPLSACKKFRQQIKAIATPILPELTALIAGATNLINVDMGDQETIAKIGLTLGPLLIDGPDLMIDLAIDYWPSISADLDYVMSHATTADAMRLFGKAVADAYPFGQMMTVLPISANGGSAHAGDGM